MVDDLEESQVQESLEAITMQSPQKPATTPSFFRPPKSKDSPAKRTSDTEGDNSEMFKRLRSIASQSIAEAERTHPPATATARPVRRKAQSKLVAPASSTMSKVSPFARSDFSRTSSTNSNCSTDTNFSTSTMESDFTFTGSRMTVTPPTSAEGSSNSIPSINESSWKPLAARDPSERLIYITPPTSYQAMLNKKQVRFHVQWELERLIARNPSISWDDFQLSDLDCLKGTAAEAAPNLESLIAVVEQRKLAQDHGEISSKSAKPISDKHRRLWNEVDLEELSISMNDRRGVGNEDINWPYGGKISYCVVVQPITTEGKAIQAVSTTLPPYTSSPTSASSKVGRRQSDNSNGPIEATDNNPFRPPSSSTTSSLTSLPFEMKLRAPDIPGKSFRLARRFGSRRTITFKLKNCRSNHRDQLLDLFRGRIFALFGKTFRAIWADGDSVHAIETNDSVEVLGKKLGQKCLEQGVLSFREVFAMYNHLSLKADQAMAKWAARPQILFSDSVPATRVARSAIQTVPDIITRDAEIAGHASTEQTLTDGCGLMSPALAERIYSNQNLQLTHGRPSAAQIRIGGSKGVVTIMSRSETLLYPGIDIVLRDSMVKAFSDVKYQDDPSLLTVDVLRCDSLKIGTSISSEAIIAMAHGGVPSSVFEKMVEDGINELREELYPKSLQIDETKEDVLKRLIKSIYRRGGIEMERDKRKAREEGKSSKVIGLVSKGSNELELGDDGDPLLVEASERFEVDPVTGQPGSIPECLYEAFLNGVDPSTSHFAGQKLKSFIDVTSKRMVREFKIPVKQSLSAFIVPDTLGVLAPDEIFISFGEGDKRAPEDPITKSLMRCLEGDCLAFRSPCKLPTDVRKFKAVYKDELSHLKDVIVMSANPEECKRSPASFLGGGDYDGDTAQLFWGKDLVDQFTNADEVFAEVPEDFVKDNFDKQVVKGTEFLEVMDGKDEETIIANMQYWLLGGMMSNDATSDYSNMHGNAVYIHGYAHEETTRLARMFCHVLDARKSGLKVKREVKVNDMRSYGGDLEWRAWKKGTVAGEGGVRVVQRGRGLGGFIMDDLKRVGERKQRELIGEWKALIAKPTLKDYEDLITPWKEQMDDISTPNHQGPRDEMQMILQHVSICYELYELINRGQYDPKRLIEKSYIELLTGGEVIPTPRKNKTPKMFMSSREIVIAEAYNQENSLKRLSLLRQLAVVWREYPKDKITSNPRKSRRLKVGAGAEIMRDLKGKTHIKFPFDIDFRMACAIKAEMYDPERDPFSGVPALREIMKPK